jgi:hypothetical protein
MAGVTGSSGLNNLTQDTNVTQTTLPSWYQTAQQNIANQAGTASTAAPAFGQTVAQGAVNTLSGANNPFTQAQGTLNTIASGAANPWITDASGNVTPNTSTALGGLFQAENQQLNQILPYATAPVESANIASGNFGSLRGQQAEDAARGVAQANLTAQQMQSALSNQQTGASAANALGNVGAQGISSGLTTGAAQMNAPYQNSLDYANLINSINVPATVSQQTQASPLSQLSTLAGIPTTAGNLLSSVFGSSTTNGTLANAISNIPGLSSLFGTDTGSTGTTVTNDSSGNSTVSLNNGNGSVSTTTPINDQYTTPTGGDVTAPTEG